MVPCFSNYDGNVSLGRSSLFTVFLVFDLYSWQCAKLMGSRDGLVKRLEWSNGFFLKPQTG